jgi:hypothetical protein
MHCVAALTARHREGAHRASDRHGIRRERYSRYESRACVLLTVNTMTEQLTHRAGFGIDAIAPQRQPPVYRVIVTSRWSFYPTGSNTTTGICRSVFFA